MKKSAARTLGVVALGVAAAAAAAGTASAAPAIGAAGPLDTVTGIAGPLANTLNHSQDAQAEQSGGQATDPVQGLLGGIPLAGGLPLGG
ncbi:hypothetical protein [Streptomyces sp. NPDC089919]|uniref:hypothetical protein n=1 Tax=Streptomyces sp. NPDC089919 TaxID=3155188 RepID=UPI003439E948